MPSKPPPIGLPRLTYCPVAPVGEPISSPPLTTRQRLGSLPKFPHVGVNTVMVLGWLPLALKTLAVTLPGRNCWMSCRYSGVSTNAIPVLATLFLNPSYEKKKNDLFFPQNVVGPPSPKCGSGNGPPMLPPNCRT